MLPIVCEASRESDGIVSRRVLFVEGRMYRMSAARYRICGGCDCRTPWRFWKLQSEEGVTLFDLITSMFGGGGCFKRWRSFERGAQQPNPSRRGWDTERVAGIALPRN